MSTTTVAFKDVLDIPAWRPAAPSNFAPTSGSLLASDMRNDATRDPWIYFWIGSSSLQKYLPHNDGWILQSASFTSGNFGAGSAMQFHPSQGPRGTLAAGATTISVVLSTALPAAVAVDQLANRGDGVGYRIRIIGNTSGGSGKIEERTIIGNTSGTTPTLLLDSALSFTPATGDAYELISGRLFMYGGATTANTFRWYDVATNSANGSTLNSPATGSTSAACMICLSELHVPWNRAPGEGFFGNLVATGSATGTITGMAALGDSSVIVNQFRNFQVRIVQDTATPTAVGQRRRISSHTAGTSAVYTLASNWTVTPSSTCTFVIENDDDKIMLMHDGSTSTFNYNIAAGTWDTSTWAAAGNARGVGAAAAQSFGIALGSSYTIDAARHSNIFVLRGGTSFTIDVLDIAGASTGSWSAAITYTNTPIAAVAAGTSAAYDPIGNRGRYWYINTVSQHNFRLDLQCRIGESWSYIRRPQSTGVAGNRAALACFVDGSVKLPFLYQMLHLTTSEFYSTLLQR